jgi:GTPase SAR1 family protein
MEELVQLERKIQALYDNDLAPLAGRFEFELPTSAKDATGAPNVLFLGNHSSGKSSFINYLIQSEVQKTGLAPIDDGFTIITYGERQDEFDGQTVVTHPDLPYNKLQQFGPEFLSRLRLKTHPNSLLRNITLIDSPGMIDAADGTGARRSRGYDFTSSVRWFAENADLILFFFDPDKPGTTGETLSVFTKALSHLEYKLLIIMNKVDLFSNLRDFARTYGTLCWNLSRTLKSKDMPHIFNTYLPNLAIDRPHGSAVSMQDFDTSRGEVVAEIQRSPTRRTDNLVSDLHKSARRLSMHTKVCQEISNLYFRMRAKLWGLTTILLLGTAALIYLIQGTESVSASEILRTLIFGLVLTLVSGCFAYWSGIRFKKNFENKAGMDKLFQKAFRKDLTLSDRPDLRALWEDIWEQTASVMKVIGPEKVSKSRQTRKLMKRLDLLIREDIPQLRRSVADYHKNLQKRDQDPGNAESNG